MIKHPGIQEPTKVLAIIQVGVHGVWVTGVEVDMEVRLKIH